MNCGTYNGYQQHLRQKTKACDACKQANAKRRRDYYASNSNKVYEINRRWAAKNPEKVKEYSRRIFAKRKALKQENGHVPYTEAEVLEIYGLVCHVCNLDINIEAPRVTSGGDGWELGLQLDHVIPLSKGGSDSIDNIKPIHVLCNMKKGGRY
jgi:5-methylcytosine-specific restriction endonuclease McrA